MLLNMYIAPGQGQTTLGDKCWCQQKALITLLICCKFKMIALKYDFKHILNDFIHAYSPRAETDNPLGTKFWCQQKFLITLSICCKFQNDLFEIWFYTHFKWLYMCIAPGQGRKPLGDTLLMSTESPYHFDHLLQVSNKSLRILILYTFLMFFHMYIAPG